MAEAVGALDDPERPPALGEHLALRPRRPLPGPGRNGAGLARRIGRSDDSPAIGRSFVGKFDTPDSPLFAWPPLAPPFGHLRSDPRVWLVFGPDSPAEGAKAPEAPQANVRAPSGPPPPAFRRDIRRLGPGAVPAPPTARSGRPPGGRSGENYPPPKSGYPGATDKRSPAPGTVLATFICNVLILLATHDSDRNVRSLENRTFLSP